MNDFLMKINMWQRLLIVFLFSSLAACGMQGGLYLPGEKKTKAAIHDVKNRVNQQILKLV